MSQAKSIQIENPGFEQPVTVVTYPRYIQEIAERLSQLPAEVVWPIIEELPIFKILQLSASLSGPALYDEYFGGCHKHRAIFPTVEHFANIRNLFVFYYSIRMILKWTHNPPGTPLSIRANDLYQDKPLTHHVLRRYLTTSISTALSNPRHKHRSSLNDFLQTHYHQKWDPDPLFSNHSTKIQIDAPKEKRYLFTRLTMSWHAEIPTYYHGIPMPFSKDKQADQHHMIHERLKDVQFFEKPIYLDRAAQILRIATLMETHSTNTPQPLLKKSTDPLQKPRANPQHIVQLLKALATRSSNYALHSRWTTRYSGDWIFRYDLFPLVPFDHTLQLFIQQTVALKHRLPLDLQKMIDGNTTTAADNDNNKDLPTTILQTQPTTTRSEPPLPGSLLQDLRTIIEGMAYVYTHPNLGTTTTSSSSNRRPTILRTKYTPWSAEPWRLVRPASPRNTADTASPAAPIPIFTSPPCPHLDAVSPDKRDVGCVREYELSYRNTYPEREVRWVEAFCRVVGGRWFGEVR